MTDQTPEQPDQPHQPDQPAPPKKHHVQNERDVVRQQMANGQQKIADAMTAFSGSMLFVYLHLGWFAVWLLLNLGVFGQALVFDPFPFGLLTLIVSLEAIFLSTFVLISQNRQATRADIRSELDYETNVRSEIWSRAIAAKVGVDYSEVERHIHRAIAADRKSMSDS